MAMDGYVYLISGLALQILTGIFCWNNMTECVIVTISVGVFLVLIGVGAIIRKQSQIIEALNNQNKFLIAVLQSNGVEVVNE